MNILRTYKELTSRDTYRMTKDAAIQTLNKLEDGAIITPVNFLLYEDVDRDGKQQEILSIMDDSGSVVAFQSATAKRSFFDILDCFNGDLDGVQIMKISGTTKSGRGYVNFTLV